MQQTLAPTAGRYIPQQKLDEGGMGAVYRTIDRLTQQAVALKRVTVPAEQLQFASRASMGNCSNFRLALAREFKTLASLRHPHIISVLDYGFDEQRQPYLIMELLQDAPNLIEAGRDQPLPKQVELLVQLLQALAYLHRRGVIHCDLKPDNVLVIEGQVKRPYLSDTSGI
jgi:serine/threonine protein kinase